MPRLLLTKEKSGYIFIYACDTDVTYFIKQHKVFLLFRVVEVQRT